MDIGYSISRLHTPVKTYQDNVMYGVHKGVQTDDGTAEITKRAILLSKE